MSLPLVLEICLADKADFWNPQELGILNLLQLSHRWLAMLLQYYSQCEEGNCAQGGGV
jgi:hypothetical protein